MYKSLTIGSHSPGQTYLLFAKRTYVVLNGQVLLDSQFGRETASGVQVIAHQALGVTGHSEGGGDRVGIRVLTGVRVRV